ncbi:cob(I)yrinic acid a,c-diamide adenosyltransferase [Alicyclobacillus tolerans]|uniref:cob(I)yrinic acid a,c-diamide adenosyltransferase n=1 Tax=Alicyclobacillus tolerans TaxID=90970 RepID=UPI001F000C1B|nr:cob(I)yrinic acid a,c-diamide adenosyltransferase [Alicyclobacillus tolerans]MCF8563448.1 cob(I)yrinic acid a,c-diamide adenosyltransferase [Alicyclobacillus tolerans]
MKIYTRSGDTGQTSLIYGRRVDKDSLRVQSYGMVDEANSAIGLALSLLPAEPGFDDLRRFGTRIQRDLFDVGRDLATPEDKREGFFVGEEDIAVLERIIDVLDAANPPLTRFVLPGGHPAAAAFHVARTSARAAERQIVALQKTESVPIAIAKYLNRLSDLLFVAARTVNTRVGAVEPGVDFGAEKPDPFGDEHHGG